MEADFLAAYYNALMYNITWRRSACQKSVEIIDAYSATTTSIVGADAALNGLYGCMLANAAEIMALHLYRMAGRKTTAGRDHR